MSRAGRRAGAAGVVVLLGLATAGCVQPSNTPGAYDDVTKSNFVQGCTQNYAVGGTTSTLGTGSEPSVCECAYDWFVQNLPFDEDDATAQGKPAEPNFKQLDDVLDDDPNAVPAEVTSALAEECPGFAETADQPPLGPVAPTTGTSEPR